MRKVWTSKEDQCLKMLRDELQINKWSEISRKMVQEYGIVGRSQKQCRERQHFLDNRYHNHLDSSIKNARLAKDREIEFFKLHDQIGNRWSSIARHFQGLSDNYLKNTFHSKLRGAIRKLNRFLKEDLSANYNPYPLDIIYRVVEVCEKLRQQKSNNTQQRDFCTQLKNKLIEFNGGKTVHCFFKGWSNQAMSQDLMLDLEQFRRRFLNWPTKETTDRDCVSGTNLENGLSDMTDEIDSDQSESKPLQERPLWKTGPRKHETEQERGSASEQCSPQHETSECPLEIEWRSKLTSLTPQSANEDESVLNFQNEEEFSIVREDLCRRWDEQSIEVLPMPFTPSLSEKFEASDPFNYFSSRRNPCFFE